MLKRSCYSIALLAASLGGLDDVASAQRPAVAAARPPAFKGIFEPVPYGADVTLNDVFFVTPEVGWATGGNALTNGVLIGTKDGGETWTVQVGDPESNETPYSHLRFVDGRVGFAVQVAPGSEDRLLRTLDGENWAVVGTVPDHRRDYTFLSSTVGVTVYGESVRRSQDAGKTWKEVFSCRIKVQVQGLTRDARCYLEDFHFPTRRIGYGIGYSPDAPGVFMAKTENSGETWTAWQVLPDHRGYESHLFFRDANRGTACLTAGVFASTDDGGRTWNLVPGPTCNGKQDVRFADPEVGWAFSYAEFNFTTDGGRKWTGRTVAFPTFVTAFSLPRRDRGYVVGDHGMVYRYRVVPANTPSKPNEFAAPLMPSFSSEVDDRVAELDAAISSLEEAVAAAPDSSPTADTAVASAVADGVFADLDTAVTPSDSSVEAVPVPSADLPPASPFMESCCAKSQGRARLLLSAIVSALPSLLEKHRNTNTIGGTLLMLVELPLKVKSLRGSLLMLWKAPDRAAAQAAIAQLSAAAGELKATTAMAFQTVPVQSAGSAAAPPPYDVAPVSLTDSLGAPVAAPATAVQAKEKAADLAKKGLSRLLKKKPKIPR